MKKCIMLISAALIIFDAHSMNDNPKLQRSSISRSTERPKIRRADSRARIHILENKEELPEPMSTEEYIDMLKKFLKENNQLIDSTEFINTLDALFDAQKGIKLTDFYGDKYRESKPFRKDNISIVDVSCPNIIRYAKERLSRYKKELADDKSLSERLSELKNGVNPSDLDQRHALEFKHLKWIIEHFEPYVKKIQSHEIDPNDKYDSGLTDEDIELLIKLTVGNDYNHERVFDRYGRSTDIKHNGKTYRFIEDGLEVILRNATGFQRILSILIMSIFNRADRKKVSEPWQIKVEFFSGGIDRSYQLGQKIGINFDDLDTFTLDTLIFHEMTHVFHHMLNFGVYSDILLSNISIINSRDINLIDQYFPTLRPHVMNPVLDQLKKLIDQYFGHDFSKINEEEKQKLIVGILEPLMRKAMMNGLGNFIFPYYKQNNLVKISMNLLTTERMATCIYLSGILANKTVFDPQYDKKSDSMKVRTNKLVDFKVHPLFNKVKVSLSKVNIEDEDWQKSDSIWNSAEEKLTMQGNSVLARNGHLYYIQDRQNEQIYLIRNQKEQTGHYSIDSHFRYHQIVKNRELYVLKCFTDLDDLCPSIKLLENIERNSRKEFQSLNDQIKNAFNPSSEQKYGLPNENKIALTEAVKNGDTERVKELLDRGLDCEFRDAEGNNLIYYVLNFLNDPNFSIEKAKDIIKMLLDKGVDLNNQNYKGNTVLHEISNIVNFETDEEFEKQEELMMFLEKFKKTEKFIMFLKECGINLECKNVKRETPLLYAVRKRPDSASMIRYFLNAGAKIDAVNNKGQTAFHYVATFLKKENVGSADTQAIIKQLQSIINLEDYDGNTMLHIFAKRSAEFERSELLDLFVMMLFRGADPKIKNSEGKFPADLAKLALFDALHDDSLSEEQRNDLYEKLRYVSSLERWGGWRR